MRKREERLFPLHDGGFAIASADGWLTVVDRTGKARFTRDLLALTAGYTPDDAYTVSRATKLLSWTNPPVTPPIKEGWAILRPKDDELTTFTAPLPLPAGNHMLGIEAVNMEDCYLKVVDVR